jgi:hypothetical protein
MPDDDIEPLLRNGSVSLRAADKFGWLPQALGAFAQSGGSGPEAAPILGGMVKDVAKTAAYPGEVAQAGYAGNAPSVGEMIPGAMNLGMSAVGLGSPFAEAGALGSAGGKGIRAYHGSPYDFDRFDLSKIGSGEGAQAYGHGLYFAENPDVATGYRQRLTQADNSRLNFQVTHEPNKRGDWSATGYAADGTPIVGDRFGSQADAAAWVDKQKQGRAKGSMYEVTINGHPDEFLDWDKPLSEQSPQVREAFSKLSLPNMDVSGQSLVRNYLPDVKYAVKGPEGSFVAANAKNYQDALAEAGGDKNAVRIIHDPSPEAATRQLRDAGIKGIKYLDQGSRDPVKMKELADDLAQYKEAAKHWEATGNQEKLAIANKQIDVLTNRLNQTRNYVVFDDKLIDIVRKYGLAGLLGAGAYHFKTSGNHDNPHIPGPI